MRVLSSAKWVWSFAVSGGMLLVLGGSAMASDGAKDSGMEVVQEAHTVTTVKSSGSGDVHVMVAQDSHTQIEAGVEAKELKSVPAASSTQAKVETLEMAVKEESLTPAEVKSSPVDVVTVTALSAPVAEAAVDSNDVAAVKTVSIVSSSVFQPMRQMAASAVAPTVKDIATSHSMPTAATNTNSPLAPAQPTGVLGHLSAQLAGSVVKPVFLPMVAALGASMFTLMILLTLLNRSKIVKIFAVGTRREGFAHAPRSDVAAATFNSYFATPFSMSYVTANRLDTAHF